MHALNQARKMIMPQELSYLSHKIIALIDAVQNNNAKKAYALVQTLTPSERASLAHWLQETTTFLNRVNKAWYETMNFPAENEE